MAQLIVEVSRIDEIRTHPNADALDLAVIKGWQCVVPKGRYSTGALVTYIPIDALIPEEHSDRWGITKYLSKGRVRCARLRGEPSFGVVLDREQDWPEGTDVAEHYGITKYEPPVIMQGGDHAPAHGLFPEYTDVENLRNFPDLLVEGETVAITEKIHGTNCRVGVIEGEEMAGSMSVRRKRPENTLLASTYWLPWTLEPVREMLHRLAEEHRQVVLFGEIFGSKIQNLHYGETGSLGFRAFDLLVDGRYLDYSRFEALCRDQGVATAPVLAVEAYSLERVKALSGGTTMLGADHIREGVVVRPLEERTHPKVGRVLLKYISDDYLLAKGITDSKDV